MQITIATRLKPFTHVPGSYFILPFSTLRLQIFPCLILVDDLKESLPKRVLEIKVPVLGVVDDFTAQLNLEKGLIEVFGKDEKGYFRYEISQSTDLLAILVKKGLDKSFNRCEIIKNKAFFSKLSLGANKALDWQLVKRRLSLKEILPCYLRLAEMTADFDISESCKTPSLLSVSSQASKENSYNALKNLFLAGFEGVLSPRAKDLDYQGFNFDPVAEGESPLILLKKAKSIITNLFVAFKETEISVLTNLPKEFESGRFLDVILEDHGKIDLEWTKNQPRRLIFLPKKTSTFFFHFPKEIKRFRLNKKEILNNNQPILLQKEQLYLFDNFQK